MGLFIRELKRLSLLYAEDCGVLRKALVKNVEGAPWQGTVFSSFNRFNLLYIEDCWVGMGFC